ncbi:unnamed protein product, partial [Symbiodinium sp. KB8]
MTLPSLADVRPSRQPQEVAEKMDEEPCFGPENQDAVACVFVINGSQHASKAVEDDAESPLSSFSREQPSKRSWRMPSPPDRCMHDRHERSLKSYLM